jgi:dTDP-4-amino-4,6-dideoxygalactose transaminase
MPGKPRIPLLRPRPARLSKLVRELEAIEDSGIYSNYGPVNTRFEAELTARMFGGIGGCLTVNNATSGLMLAIRDAAVPGRGTRYALMPSFTFAATAHAAMWAGLTPLLCDIDPATWNPCPDSEARLLRRYAGQVACVVPYACFGNGLDLDRYARMAREQGVGMVVDAAASLGARDAAGQGFGTGFPHPIVFSMHVTKTFATGEAGVIYCDDAARLERLRAMGNFGFGRPREATLPGLNAKLSEVGALLALQKLAEFDGIVQHRETLAAAYRRRLPDCVFQATLGSRLANQFMPVLLPADCAMPRADIVGRMTRQGIGVGHYFSPHLAEQAFFAEHCVADALPVTRGVAARVLSLPMADVMTEAEVAVVADCLNACLH